jgi:hypothetical protein
VEEVVLVGARRNDGEVDSALKFVWRDISAY